jgi:hypothetical protein
MYDAPLVEDLAVAMQKFLNWQDGKVWSGAAA